MRRNKISKGLIVHHIEVRNSSYLLCINVVYIFFGVLRKNMIAR